MVEEVSKDKQCSSCARLKQELESTKKEQASTLKVIKEKIISTDKLIKKYQKKCDDFDKQGRSLKDLNTKYEECKRNKDDLQEQLNRSLEITEPQKKNITRLIQEKFVYEEKILELKTKNTELEGTISSLESSLQGKDDMQLEWKKDQQEHDKKLEKEKERVAKLKEELNKLKDERRKDKVVIRRKARELSVQLEKREELQAQVNIMKQQLKTLKSQNNKKKSNQDESLDVTDAKLLRSGKRLQTTVTTPSAKENVNSQGLQVSSILDEMLGLHVPALSPLPVCLEDSSSSDSDDSSDYQSSDNDDSDSLSDFVGALETELEKQCIENDAIFSDDDNVKSQNNLLGSEDKANIMKEKTLNLSSIELDMDKSEGNRSNFSDVENENPEVIENIWESLSDHEDVFEQPIDNLDEKKSANDQSRQDDLEKERDENALESLSDDESALELPIDKTAKITNDDSRQNRLEREIYESKILENVLGSLSDLESDPELQSDDEDDEDQEEENTKCAFKENVPKKQDSFSDNNQSHCSLKEEEEDSKNDTKDENLEQASCQTRQTDSDNESRPQIMESLCDDTSTSSRKTSNDFKTELLPADNSDKDELDVTTGELFGGNLHDLPKKNTSKVSDDGVQSEQGTEQEKDCTSLLSFDKKKEINDGSIEQKLSHSLKLGEGDNTSNIKMDDKDTVNGESGNIKSCFNNPTSQDDICMKTDESKVELKGETKQLLCIDDNNTLHNRQESTQGNLAMLKADSMLKGQHITHDTISTRLSSAIKSKTPIEEEGGAIHESQKRKSSSSIERKPEETYDETKEVVENLPSGSSCGAREVDESNEKEDTFDSLNKGRVIHESQKRKSSSSIERKPKETYDETEEMIENLPSGSSCGAREVDESNEKVLDLPSEPQTTEDVSPNDISKNAMEHNVTHSNDNPDNCNVNERVKNVQYLDKSHMESQEKHRESKEVSMEGTFFGSSKEESKESTNTPKETESYSNIYHSKKRIAHRPQTKLLEGKNDSFLLNKKAKILKESFSKSVNKKTNSGVPISACIEGVTNLEQKTFEEKERKSVSKSVNKKTNSGVPISACIEGVTNLDQRTSEEKERKSVIKSVNKNANSGVSNPANIEASSNLEQRTSQTKRRTKDYSVNNKRKKSETQVEVQLSVSNDMGLFTSLSKENSISKEKNNNEVAACGNTACEDFKNDNVIPAEQTERRDGAHMIVENEMEKSLGNKKSLGKEKVLSSSEHDGTSSRIVENELTQGDVEFESEDLDNTLVIADSEEPIQDKLPCSLDRNDVDNLVNDFEKIEEVSSKTDFDFKGLDDEPCDSDLQETLKLFCNEDIDDPNSGLELNVSEGTSATSDVHSTDHIDNTDLNIHLNKLEMNKKLSSKSNQGASSMQSKDQDQKKAKAIPRQLSIEEVLDDCLGVFMGVSPVLEPLPPSPTRTVNDSDHKSDFSRVNLVGMQKVFGTSCEQTEKHFKNLLSSSNQHSKLNMTPASVQTTKDVQQQQQEKEVLGAAGANLNDTIAPIKKAKKKKSKKKGSNIFSTRPAFLSELQYTTKALKHLYANDIDMKELLTRLSNKENLSTTTTFAAALMVFKNDEDFMVEIIRYFHERNREQTTHDATSLMSSFEQRVMELLKQLENVEHLKGLSSLVVTYLYKAILFSYLKPGKEGPDKRSIASYCRIMCGLCRQNGDLSRMRILCYDIIRHLHCHPGSVLYLVTSIAAVWPAVFSYTSQDRETTGEGFREPLVSTMHAIILHLVRAVNWPMLGNIINWFCSWKQVNPVISNLQELCDGLVKLMKNSSFAKLMEDKDGYPVLGYGLYEVVKSIELIACVQGWVWLSNVLIRDIIWDILSSWATQTHFSTTTKEQDEMLDSKDITSTREENLNLICEPTVVATIRLLGLVCRLAIEQQQNEIPHVTSMLLGILRNKTQDNKVTFAIQLAIAYTLLEISPWQPQEVATALNTWKEDQQAKRVVPESLQQGLNALRSSLLNVGHAQTQHVEKR